jgi:uncharacterized protein
MGKVLGWFLTIVLALAAVSLGARFYATRVMSQRALVPKTLGSATPQSVGVPFTRLPIESGDRTLIAWWVKAPADSGKLAPAVLFLHGNRSSISDYPSLQRFFYRQGISSLVFDYSGFGASGGTPSLQNAVADAGRVARVFADAAGAGARKVAMGSALGATVLLQAIDSVQPHVDGVVIEGVDASVRGAAVRSGRLPGFLAPAVVDIGDNVSAAARVSVPVLAVHSVADARVPIAEAESVVAAVPGRSALVKHPRRGHSAILTSSRPCDWAAVLTFVKEGTLPASKIDTVDACEEEAPVAAPTATKTPAGTTTGTTTGTASRAADSIKTAPTKAIAPTSTKSATPTTTKTKAPTTTKAKALTTTKTKAPATTTKAPSSTKTKTPASKTKSGTKRP